MAGDPMSVGQTRQRGTAIVEATIALPLLLTIFLFVTHFGLSSRALVRDQAASGFVQSRGTRGKETDGHWKDEVDDLFGFRPKGPVAKKGKGNKIIGSTFHGAFPRSVQEDRHWTLPSSHPELAMKRAMQHKTSRASWVRRPLGGQPVFAATQTYSLVKAGISLGQWGSSSKSSDSVGSMEGIGSGEEMGGAGDLGIFDSILGLGGEGSGGVQDALSGFLGGESGGSLGSDALDDFITGWGSPETQGAQTAEDLMGGGLGERLFEGVLEGAGAGLGDSFSDQSATAQEIFSSVMTGTFDPMSLLFEEILGQAMSQAPQEGDEE